MKPPSNKNPFEIEGSMRAPRSIMTGVKRTKLQSMAINTVVSSTNTITGDYPIRKMALAAGLLKLYHPKMICLLLAGLFTYRRSAGVLPIVYLSLFTCRTFVYF